MAITVSVADGPSFTIEGDSATVGRDPNCAISLPDDPRLKWQHASFRRVAGRWMVEARDGDELQVGTEPPAKVKWLAPGDSIDLTPDGPRLLFQPAAPVPARPAAARPPHGGAQTFDRAPEQRPAPVFATLESPPDDGGRSKDALHGTHSPIVWALAGAGLVLAGVVVASVLFSSRGRPPKETDNAGNSTKPVQPAEPGDETAKAHAGAVPEEHASAAPATAPSATDDLVAQVRDALYVVLLKGPDHDETYRLGTAWAVSPTTLVTSGAVGLALEQEKGSLPKITVSSGEWQPEFDAGDIKVHPAYRAADADGKAAVSELEGIDAEMARAPEKARADELAKNHAAAQERLFHAFELQVTFDLAVLEVTGTLPKALAVSSGGELKRADPVWVAGHPFGHDEFVVDRSHPAKSRGLKGSVFLKQPLAQSPEPAAHLLIRVEADLTGQNWVGCPIFDAAGKVVAVYSRPTPPLPPADDGTPAPATHEVTEIGKLKALLSK